MQFIKIKNFIKQLISYLKKIRVLNDFFVLIVLSLPGFITSPLDYYYYNNYVFLFLFIFYMLINLFALFFYKDLIQETRICYFVIEKTKNVLVKKKDIFFFIKIFFLTTVFINIFRLIYLFIRYNGAHSVFGLFNFSLYFFLITLLYIFFFFFFKKK